MGGTKLQVGYGGRWSSARVIRVGRLCSKGQEIRTSR